MSDGRYLSRFSAVAGALFLILHAASAAAQVGPNVVPGFPNVAQTPGAILSGLNAPQQGRTAVLAYHNGVLFTVPEIPSSQPGADFQVRTWDISDPTQPVVLAQWGTTPHPIAAHGYFKSGQYLIIGSNWPPESPWSFVPDSAQHTVERTSFPELTCAGARGCLFGPWYVNQTFWSYNEVSGDAEIYIDWVLQSSWDHLGLTGVVGHPFLLGDLLIFASDQSRTGVATYDVSDPTNPVLLDVLTAGGPGGYWPEIWGNEGELYIVFPYRTGGNGFRVVDATDPANLRFIADRSLPGDESMYIQFQDEFAFMGSHKVDMRTLESVLYLDGANTPRPNQPGQTGINTSQHLLPIGNLLVTGGIGPNEGMAIWAHQAEPDTRGPSVGFHIPQAGRTNYPLGAPISLLIHETLETFTIVNGETFLVRPVGGSPLEGRLTFSFDDVLTFVPDEPLLPDTSYEVVLPDGGIKDAAGNGILGYSFVFSTGSSLGGNAPPTIDELSAGPVPAAPGQSVTLSADASDADLDQLEYRFDFGDGSPKTAWSSSDTVATSYAETGHYRASVQVRDEAGSITTETVTITVIVAPSGPAPTNSGPIFCDSERRDVWIVNPDNDSITIVNPDTRVPTLEQPVCDDPRAVALSHLGEAWITCHDDDTVRVLANDGSEITSIATGHGSAPMAVAMSPDGRDAFVTLYGSGQLLRFDTESRQQFASLDLGPTARAIAVTGDGSRVLVTRFLSPRNHAEVWDVDAASMTLNRTIVLRKFGNDENADSTASGRGVANYLAGIAIAPDGQSAWVASNKPNAERGLLFGPDLDQDNTVRNIVTQIDLASSTVRGAIDIDNSDSARAVAFSPLGDYLMVTLQGNDETVVLDALAIDSSNGLGSFVTRLGTGAAPQGLCVDTETGRTFVKNFTSRDVTIQETAALFDDGNVSIGATDVGTVTNEALGPDVRLGKQIFYNASDPRMSAEGYLSCATCHVDGGHDGRVWDFTGRGEGMRNTTTLRGRAGTGHGNVHWTANFDEIQDFENDIRGAFGGSGFLSDSDFAATSNSLGAAKAGLSTDLDALAAYVTSLDAATAPRSPYRQADGEMTADAISGEALFANLGCASCHSGAELTDSTLGSANLHDVGTTRTTSGQRLGGALTGIDTPSLLGVWAGAPYFHDGSAETIEDVYRVAGGVVIEAETATPIGGAYVQNQWVQFNNDDTVHGRALVSLDGGGIEIHGVDGGSGGTGAVEIRYSVGYYNGHTLDVSVNGGPITSGAIPLLGNDPGWRHTNWRNLRLEGIVFAAGTNNTLRITTPISWANVSIDHVIVSNADDLAAAQPHRVALGLSQAQRDQLTQYLLQIEGGVAAPQPTASPTPVPDTPTPTATTAPPLFTIGGSVRHAGSAGGVGGVSISLSGEASHQTSSAASGAYSFADLQAGNWTVHAAKSDPEPPGLSALDASWALQSSIGLRAFSPIQALACDVTGNGSVSALDASHILQRLVGARTSFTAATACGSDWLIAPGDSVSGGSGPVIGSGTCQPAEIAISLDHTVTNTDWQAAAFGDCTLSGGAAATTSSLSAPPRLRHSTRRARRYERIAFVVDGEMQAFDVTLEFDPKKLELVRVRKSAGLGKSLLHSGQPTPGEARIALATATPVEPGQGAILAAVFKRLDSDRTRRDRRSRRRSSGIEVVAATIDERAVDWD